MIHRLSEWLDHAPRWVQVSACLALIALVGFLDFLTGYEIAFSIFYLAPISIAAWYGSRGSGALASGLSAVTSLAMDLVNAHPYSHAAIPYWSALVQLGFFLVTTHLLAELRRHVRLEERLARVDPLTGAHNLRGLLEEGGRLVRLASRRQRAFSLVYIDLDSFKAVNDSFGHGDGDRLLKAVVHALKGSVRESDMVARIGGDEFAVLLPDTDYAGAESALGKIRDQLSLGLTAGAGAVTASVGVATFETAPSSMEEALRIADGLMYKVKRSGKGDVLHHSWGGAPTSTPALAPAARQKVR